MAGCQVAFAVCFLAVPLGTAQSQGAAASPDERCAAALNRARSTCKSLAFYLIDTLAGRVRETTGALTPPPRAFQSMRAGGATAAGTPGQIEAAPGLQPTALAAASIASAGTDSGSKSIVAISLNPATLFGGSDQKFAAVWSRFADVTVLVPANADSKKATGRSYFGLRSRLNISGVARGGKLLRDVEAAFQDLLVAQALLEAPIVKVLTEMTTQVEVDACKAAFESSALGSPLSECGGFKLELPEKLFTEFRAAATKARDAADAQYAGLDLRLDSGDPTLSGTPERDVTSLAIGLGFGKRNLAANSSQTMSAIRMYIGARYTDPREGTDPVLYSADGGVAFELSRLVQTDQYVQFSAGLEGRSSNGTQLERDKTQPNFLKLQSGVTIPVAGGASVSAGFSAPLIGKIGPSLTVNFNWGLLLGGAASAIGR